MREFQVSVIRTDVYTIRIDEDKIDKDLIKEFERDIHNLGTDKVMNLAKVIGFNTCSAIDSNGFIEGIGNVKIDNITFGEDCEKGIEVEIVEIEDYEIEVNEN